MSWQRPNIGSRVTREGHARFWERPAVRLLRATRQSRRFRDVRVTSAYAPRAATKRTWKPFALARSIEDLKAPRQILPAGLRCAGQSQSSHSRSLEHVA